MKWWIYVSSIVTYLCKNSFFVVLKQLQIALWIVNVLLFLIDCEQTLHPLWTQLSHWQMFMQNGEYTAFWYLQLQLMIPQNKIVEFFDVFRDNWRIWATCVFSIICTCITPFKAKIPPLNHCFLWGKVHITLLKPLLCLNSIFSHQKAMLFQCTEFRFFSLFWKFARVASLI